MKHPGHTKHFSPMAIELHPLYQDQVILPTRALEESVNEIKRWIENLMPGGIVYGRQRHGKSKAIEYLSDNITLVCGSLIPVYTLVAWECLHNQHVSETRFYMEMLEALGYERTESMSLAKLRTRTLGFVEQKVRDVAQNQFVLFIDEAQNLTMSFFGYLIKLHNELEKRKIRLLVVLVGQPELEGMRSAMIKGKKREIVGRFMTGFHELKGIENVEDLKRMYESIDTGSEYPIGSKISYSQYFVPNAFSHGWRLTDHTERVWTCIRKSLHSDGYTVPNQIDMQAMMAFVRYLLSELSAMDDDHLELTDSMIEAMLAYAALDQIEMDAQTEKQ